MCLHVAISQTAPFVADKDIIVFKRVHKKYGTRRRGESKEKWTSWYQGYKYAKGYQYTNDNFPEVMHFTHGSIIEEEALHSYSIESIRSTLRTSFSKRHYCKDPGSKDRIIECLIPKGAMYYTDFAGNEIASSSLIVIGKVSMKRMEEICDKRRELKPRKIPFVNS